VLKARIPAIKDYTLRRKAPRVSRFDHRREVIVLGHRVLLLVKNAIVNRDVTITISPEQSNKVDAGNNPVMLARPMANNQLHLPGIWLVQSRVVYDQNTLVQAYLALGFRPKGCGVRLKSVQQASERIMGWCLLFVALYFSRFGRANGARRGNQKVNVVVIRAFGRIHALFLLHFLSTA